MKLAQFVVLLGKVCRIAAALPRDVNNGEAAFVSRPDLRPVLPNITAYQPDLISPGFWFFAPYLAGGGEGGVLQSFAPYQTGPHIFDRYGDLIWSGGLISNWSRVYDFRKTRYNGSDALSLLVAVGNADGAEAKTKGIILNSSYEIIQTVFASNGKGFINMHEFNVLDDGRSALLITTRLCNLSSPIFRDRDEHPRYFPDRITEVVDNGFQEVDVETGQVKFEWWMFDHVPVLDTHWKGVSDVYHMNSVDRTAGSDYIISARHTSAIYMISGRDGSIIWQLGGPHSSFVHVNNFTFSSQHDARVQSQNETHMIISILNNAADPVMITANCSSAQLILLSVATSPMTATVLRQWDRPDGQLSDRRGNAQVLSDGNIVTGWAGRGYVSEFTHDGTLVQESHNPLGRFSEYRSYKFEWTAANHLTESIALASHVYNSTVGTFTTVLHASWNGATNVATWNFYSSATKDMRHGASLLAAVPRQGFETGVTVPGYHAFVFVEAMAKDGTSLQNSTVTTTILPPLYAHNKQLNDESVTKAAALHHASMFAADYSGLYLSWGSLLALIILSGLTTYAGLWLRQLVKSRRRLGWSQLPTEDDE